MASFNNVQLLGNIGSVEVKTFQNGGKIVEASLATTKRFKDRSGQQREETQWHRVVFSGPSADNAERLVVKGVAVFLTGELTYRKYQDRNGVEREKAEVRVDFWQILTKTDKPAAAAPAPQQGAAPENPYLRDLVDDLP